jgi:branched-chain amino acid transport system ATP-binding protein
VTLLDVVGVSVRFGGHQALFDVSFGAESGCVTGLIGPNGAGKTTLFNVITGLQPPNSGIVRIDGRDITGLAPYKRARRGLARTFQRLELFTLLTVRENIRVAADIHRGHTRDRSIVPDQVATELLDRIGLSALADAKMGELPTGQARLVELGRALATRPRLLLLDEPASGQTEQETAAFATLLADLARDGMAVVLVEHDMPLVMRASNVIHVLDFGRIIATGSPDEIKSDSAVLTAYLGTGVGTRRGTSEA